MGLHACMRACNSPAVSLHPNNRNNSSNKYQQKKQEKANKNKQTTATNANTSSKQTERTTKKQATAATEQKQNSNKATKRISLPPLILSDLFKTLNAFFAGFPRHIFCNCSPSLQWRHTGREFR